MSATVRPDLPPESRLLPPAAQAGSVAATAALPAQKPGWGQAGRAGLAGGGAGGRGADAAYNMSAALFLDSCFGGGDGCGGGSDGFEQEVGS